MGSTQSTSSSNTSQTSFTRSSAPYSGLSFIASPITSENIHFKDVDSDHDDQSLDPISPMRNSLTIQNISKESLDVFDPCSHLAQSHQHNNAAMAQNASLSPISQFTEHKKTLQDKHELVSEQNEFCNKQVSSSPQSQHSVTSMGVQQLSEICRSSTMKSRKVIDLGVYRRKDNRTPKRLFSSGNAEKMIYSRSSKSRTELSDISNVEWEQQSLSFMRQPLEPGALSNFPKSIERQRMEPLGPLKSCVRQSSLTTESPSVSRVPTPPPSVLQSEQISDGEVDEVSAAGSFCAHSIRTRDRTESFNSNASRPVRVASRFDHHKGWTTPIMMSISQSLPQSSRDGLRLLTQRLLVETSSEDQEGSIKTKDIKAFNEPNSIMDTAQDPIVYRDIITHRTHFSEDMSKWKEQSISQTSTQPTKRRYQTISTSAEAQKLEDSPASPRSNNSSVQHVSMDFPQWESNIDNTLHTALLVPQLQPLQSKRNTFSLSTLIFVTVFCLTAWITINSIQQILFDQVVNENSHEYQLLMDSYYVPFLHVELTQILAGALGLILIAISVLLQFFFLKKNEQSGMSHCQNINIPSNERINVAQLKESAYLYPYIANNSKHLQSPLLRDRSKPPCSIKHRLEFGSTAVAVGIPTSFNPSAYSIGLPIRSFNNEIGLIQHVQEECAMNNTRMIDANKENSPMGFLNNRCDIFKIIRSSRFIHTLLWVLLFGLSRWCWLKAGGQGYNNSNYPILLYYIGISIVWILSVSLQGYDSKWSRIESSVISIVTLAALSLILTRSSSDVNPLNLNGWPIGPFGMSYVETKSHPVINDITFPVSLSLWLLSSGCIYGLTIIYLLSKFNKVKELSHRFVVETLFSFSVSAVIVGSVLLLVRIGVLSVTNFILNTDSNHHDESLYPSMHFCDDGCNTTYFHTSISIWIFEVFQLVINSAMVILSILLYKSCFIVISLQFISLPMSGIILSLWKSDMLNKLQCISCTCLLLLLVSMMVVKGHKSITTIRN